MELPATIYLDHAGTTAHRSRSSGGDAAFLYPLLREPVQAYITLDRKLVTPWILPGKESRRS